MKEIKFSELDKAFKKSKEQTHRLLKDAHYLYDQSKYPNSIALAILSYEELAKLYLIHNHLLKKTNITKTEWKNISSAGTHETKLTSIYKNAHNDIQKLSKSQYESIIKIEKDAGSKIQYRSKFDDIIKMSDIITKRLAKLNLIKQYCWYLEYTNKEFVTISDIYNKNNLKVLAYWLLHIVYLEFLTTLLHNKYQLKMYWEVPKHISLVRRDGYYIALQNIVKIVNSKNFSYIATRVAMMLDTFPKKLEDVSK